MKAPSEGTASLVLPGKVQPRHLDRLAIVYVRQSTLQQLEQHRESTALQYGLAERACRLGWPRPPTAPSWAVSASGFIDGRRRRARRPIRTASLRRLAEGISGQDGIARARSRASTGRRPPARQRQQRVGTDDNL